MDNISKNLLSIKDENITLIDSSVGDDGITRIQATLDYVPKACEHCGIINEGQITKYGWRRTTIRYPRAIGNTVILILKRRYFCCKEDANKPHYFLAQTSIVPKNCTISYATRKLCLEKLTEEVSMKHISKEISTSDSFVGRLMMQAERDFEPNLNFLPKVILVDEVKTTKSTEDTMSFEIMDGETHELIDILSFRSLRKLVSHFRRYTDSARENVKIIVTDMNYTYPRLIETVFSNAIVVVDKFHIINDLNRAFNKTRIKVMKNFSHSSREYKALKRYWKLLLTPHESLDYEHYRRWTYLPYLMPEIDVVRSITHLSPELEETYKVLNQLYQAVKDKDWNNYNIDFKHTEKCSEEMQVVLNHLQQHHDEIQNTFIHNYTNGPLEGSNNKIKLIKRSGYGFRNFFRFRVRVLFNFKIHKKEALITK
ncbi:ISL3 family transposase [Lentilactobacillus sp. Marseille-Q4993]|uniref:ISL3 family transposase n=1 Tax=Lentilactobacillus sp. Marseille-Q4993 TaxID=3039492 RepID=UPI0024BBF514|nr:ISL3 family transposase [Lentilactobacillus sp. Marseille-Q4993]